MKKLFLSIIVLGLFLSGNAYAAKKIIVPDFTGYACVYPLRTTNNLALYSGELIYKGENTFSVVINNRF